MPLASNVSRSVGGLLSPHVQTAGVQGNQVQQQVVTYQISMPSKVGRDDRQAEGQR